MMAKPRVRLTDEERKANKKASYKKWYDANRKREQERCRGWYADNRERSLKRSVAWQKANPERAKEFNKKSGVKWRVAHPEKSRNATMKKYGLTVADYNAMLVKQNGCCGICEAPEPGGRGYWQVDHCHKTNVVRKILCHRCNVGLGHFLDDIGLIQRALDYLKLFSVSSIWSTNNG